MKPIEGLVLSNFLGDSGGRAYAPSSAPIEGYDRLTSNTLRRAIEAYQIDESELAFVLATESRISTVQAEAILRRWTARRESYLRRAER